MAIKNILLSDSSHAQLRSVERELVIFQKLSSSPSNIFSVKLLDAFYSTNGKEGKLNAVFIVTDFVAFNLESFLGDSRNELYEEQATVIVYNLLLSLNFLHTSNVIHRDIKPANILID